MARYDQGKSTLMIPTTRLRQKILRELKALDTSLTNKGVKTTKEEIALVHEVLKEAVRQGMHNGEFPIVDELMAKYGFS